MIAMRTALLLLLFTSTTFIACEMPPGSPGEDAGSQTPLDIELFGDVGHTFRFMVSPEQAIEMEQGSPGGLFEDQYDIGAGTFADDLIVTDAADGDTYAFGKVELRLVGQSSMRPWDRIPNLRIDMDEHQDGLAIDGVEHFRLNNGQVGGIYREAVALRVWAALGYPVPGWSLVWAEAPNQWGEATRVPYTLVEVYKRSWCKHAIAGGCVNLWEAAGDLYSLLGQCQAGTCDDTRLRAFVDTASITPPGPGFAAALADYVDWDAYRSFQCLSWITGTGDDYVHNNNNIVVAERIDGKMVFLPYSVDISAGQEWYPQVRLPGYAQLAQGCQEDPDCWDALLSRCDELLGTYEGLDIVSTVVEPVIDMVAGAGMERKRDDERARQLVAWYGERAAALRADTIWTSSPCYSDEQCANRDDGLTVCDVDIGLCAEPAQGCREPCPEGSYCSPEGECLPFDL